MGEELDVTAVQEPRATEQRELWRPDVQARPPEEVRARAEEGLQETWRRAWELPFYRDKLSKAGLDPEHVPPLDEIPRTTKGAFREDEDAHPPFGTYRSVGLDDAARMATSTGTTGKPTLIFYSRGDLEVHIDVATRNLWRHGMRPGGRFTHSWPQGLYPTGVAAGRPYLDLGLLEIPVGPPFSAESARQHVELWELLRPHGFMMTGSQLQTYESAATEADTDFPGLLEGATLAFLEASCQFAEPRSRVERVYGVDLRNLGGASEIPGFSVSDCRYHTGLHVPGDHFIVEACDPNTGRSLPPGERGSLVITGFGIDAVFLRYELEDIVTVSYEPCPCGETGPRYTLLGRGADLVEVAGRGVLPLDVQLALDDQGAPEFRVLASEGADALRLEVETEDDGGALGAVLAERLGVPVALQPVSVGSLPRAQFKPRRVAS